MKDIELFIFLMGKRKVKCAEIADYFDISIRTVMRKIDNLSLEVPIVLKRGSSGGVYILPEYKKNFIKRISNSIL